MKLLVLVALTLSQFAFAKPSLTQEADQVIQVVASYFNQAEATFTSATNLCRRFNATTSDIAGVIVISYRQYGYGRFNSQKLAAKLKQNCTIAGVTYALQNMRDSGLTDGTLELASFAPAEQRSSLFVKAKPRLIDVQDLIDQESDVYSEYDYDKFCYKGNGDAVIRKMKKWSKTTEYFFSGGGGGFVLKSLKLNRGIVTYDIEMKLEDEVVPGEFRTVIIKLCN